MSGYILCQVKRAKNPYYISNISTNIYSIEELCYSFQNLHLLLCCYLYMYRWYQMLAKLLLMWHYHFPL